MYRIIVEPSEAFQRNPDHRAGALERARTESTSRVLETMRNSGLSKRFMIAMLGAGNILADLSAEEANEIAKLPGVKINETTHSIPEARHWARQICADPYEPALV